MHTVSRTSPPRGRPGPTLDRTTLRTSRLLDFCSEKELTAQTGHGIADWPLVAAKELIDNSLDACEESGVAPVVTVRVDAAGITVTDNGPGIPPETVEGVLDFSVRVSSREHCASPTRGATPPLAVTGSVPRHEHVLCLPCLAAVWGFDP